MAKLDARIVIDTKSLVSRIEAMAEYLNNADPDYPSAFVQLAMEVGEIDVKAATVLRKVKAGRYEIYPIGNLSRLLEAFEAERGVAQ